MRDLRQNRDHHRRHADSFLFLLILAFASPNNCHAFSFLPFLQPRTRRHRPAGGCFAFLWSGMKSLSKIEQET